MNRRRILSACGALLVVIAGTRSTVTGANPDAGRLSIGFDGSYRLGSWTSVEVSGGDGRPGDGLRVWIEDPDGQFVGSPPATVTTGTPGARFEVRPGRPRGKLRIERQPAAGGPPTRCEHILPEGIPATATVMLVVGRLPAAQRATRLLGRDDGQRPRVVQLEDGARLAAGAAGRDFDGCDTVIVCGRSLEGFAENSVEGIDHWVRSGGRLLFIAGASAEAVQTRGGAAAGWLPGRVTGLAVLRRFGEIEAYAQAARIPPRSTTRGVQVPLLERARRDGVTETFEGPTDAPLPLVIRRAHGFGTITWIGLDIDDEPFLGWEGSDSLILRLLGERQRQRESRSSAGRSSLPDLAAQLRVAIEQPAEPSGRSAGAPVPFAAVITLGIAYVLALFPVDWWLVSSGGGRWRLGWLSLPCLVALFSGAAWAAARHWRPAERCLANAIDVIDVDTTTGLVRGRSWAAVWEPGNARVDVALESRLPGDREDAPGEVAISWLADSGAAIGAIDADTPHPSLIAGDFSYERDLAALHGVPVAAASNRLFEAEWSLRRPPERFVTSTLSKDTQGMLSGGVTHHLPFSLEQCRLVQAGWLYDLGDLSPGTVHEVHDGPGPRSVSAALTRRVAVGERDVVSRWDASLTDTRRILEIAGWHAAAGGFEYTGMDLGRLSRLDLSPLLAVDRAVLLGFAPTDAAEAMQRWRIRSVPMRAGEQETVVMTGPGTLLVRLVLPLTDSRPEPAR